MRKKDEVNINSGGGPVFLGKVDNRKGIIKGRSDKYQNSLSTDQVNILFEKLFISIDNHPKLRFEDKTDLKTEVVELREELNKEEANESFLMRRLRNIGRMAPDILEVTLATITHPAAGFGIIAKKVAEKAKASAS